MSTPITASPILPPPLSPPPRRNKLTGRAFYESLGSPKYILAPMVDQSEFAWRLLTRSFLPAATRQEDLLAYTPMLHARLFSETQAFRDHHFQPLRRPDSLLLKENEEEERQRGLYLDGNPTLDRPLIVQFCANTPSDLLSAAKHVAPYCDAVDLNLGCPQGIAKKGHYGAFLQESPTLIREMISTLNRELDVPVTAKMRILDSKEDTLEYARLLLDAGASWICVHGRRRHQKGHETGVADWGVIRYLRERLPPNTVIFANGNVLGWQDLDRCLKATGADGVMSAEGNLCDPGIFAGEEGRRGGVSTGEYWIGRKGKGGWRMDGVVRRYLDIIYRFVLEREPPRRNPLFRTGVESEGGEAFSGEDAVNGSNEQDPEPPSKKSKREKKKITSPNLLAMQAHLFHLLRPLLSTHTHIRDRLARARAGDMVTYEDILSMIEDVTRRGLLEYEKDPGKYEEGVAGKEEGEEEEESSAKAVRECKRPWWACQAYVRPLPKEAVEKGSFTVSKREKKSGRREEGDGRLEGRKGESGREKRDEEDGVPKAEMPREGMVCG